MGYRVPPTPKKQSLRIAGRSMSPTLWGANVTIECESCEFQWEIDSSIARTPDRICPHCGHSVSSARTVKVHRADRVTLQSATVLSVGQVVVIAKDDQLNAKRVVAVAGDLVTVGDNRLWVNGVRIDDKLQRVPCSIEPAQITVDRDTLREASRWSPVNKSTGWQRTQGRAWVCEPIEPNDWLRYQHRSVYDQGRAGPVLDDYPSNIDLRRTLYPVDRITVSGIATASSSARLIIGIWSTEQQRIATIDVKGTHPFRVSFDEGVESSELPLTPSTPIAIRVAYGRIVLKELKVSRAIDYRLRPRDDQQRYPLTVPPEHVFVLGDNTPVSVDSRDYGAVPISDVIGIVSQSPDSQTD